VVIEPTADIARATTMARSLRTRFRGTFLGGMLAIGLAGLGVVGLVWQAERLAQQRSRFAAAAAHELRTPLAGLRMYGEMLSEELGDPEQAPRYAGLVAAEAERLGRVVTNVLGFTRLERGTLRVQPEPGDLAATVREAIERQRPGLEAAGATLTLRIEAGLPAARFDRDAIHQVLQNLLDNAERYTRDVADRSLIVSLARDQDALALTVSDHGRGVPAAARGHMFRAFSRDQEAQPGAGLGIGLAMVRALARAQGGSVSYADAAGGGAAFTVRLPLA
jgi:signal transduction histidine kinase